MNHGLLLEPRAKTDYVFGGKVRLAGTPLMPDGQWDIYLPEAEYQNLNGIEPYACVSFGTLNALEILERQEFGDVSNYSDRFLAKESGTDARLGNTPNNVASTLRKKGVPLQQYWPFDASIDSFTKFYNPIPEAAYTQAVAFLAKYDVGDEWVDTDAESMMDALRFSPLGVSVDAWHLNDYAICVRQGGSNHWCVIYGYERNQYWKCFDSYDNSKKKLAWDFSFEMCKRYTLHRNVVDERAFTKFLTLLKSLWPF